MRLRQMITCTILLSAMMINPMTVLRAQSDRLIQGKPHIGILLDPRPLPALLHKHLQFEDGQGLVITNVLSGSPADQAKLEKDDIILTFNSQIVRDYDSFVQDIRAHKIGDEVKLEVLHRGKTRKIKLQLGPRANGEWKYPQPQPAPAPADRMPRAPWDSKRNSQPQKRLDHQHQHTEYRYQVSANGKSVTIIISGDPGVAETPITIETDGQTITTTVQDVDMVPEEYREQVKEVLAQARQQHRDYALPELDEDDFFYRLPGFNWPNPGYRSFGQPMMPDNDIFQEMERRMQEMEQQMRRMLEEQENLRRDLKDQDKIKL